MHALVFDTDAPLCPEGAALSALPGTTRLAGLTLVRRAMLLAWRAGATSVTVVTSGSSREHWPGKRSGIPVAVAVIGPSAPLPQFGEEPVLVLSAQVLPAARTLEALVDHGVGDEPTVAVATAASCLGAALFHPGQLRSEYHPDESLVELVRRLVRSPHATPLWLGEGAYRRLDCREAVQAADAELYSELGSEADGYVDRVFNRRISAWFTRRIINLPIRPNHVTLFHCALGLLGAWMLAQWQFPLGLGGALLYQLSVALDCTDGEIARLKFQFSRSGGRLDVAADLLVTAAVFVAVARSAADRLGEPLALTLGASAVCGVAMCAATIYAMGKLQTRQRPGEASALAATNRLSEVKPKDRERRRTLLESVMNELTSRDHSVIVVACALLGRLEWVAWLAAIGSHVFWIAFAAVQLSLLRSPQVRRS